MTTFHRLEAPLTRSDLESLKAGDKVLISGVITEVLLPQAF